jgi:hypothetical protein
MSATYNWAFKPGVTNKYGVTISSSADDVQPANAVYVALFGNDTTGNGSRQKPFKTIARARTVNVAYIILGSGVYREGNLSAFVNANGGIIGDGDVIIDLTFFTGFVITGTSLRLYGIYFRATGTPYVGADMNDYIVVDCTFDGVLLQGLNGIGTNNNRASLMTGCTFINSVIAFSPTIATAINVFINNTFYNSFIYFRNNQSYTYGYHINNIFMNCNVYFVSHEPVDYCIFYQCNFRFNASIGTIPATYYPTVPAGYTYISTLSALQSAYNSAFAVANTFLKSAITDPLFNNASINDFTLSFSSPARNFSYKGTYIGSKSIAQRVKVSGISEADGSFEYASMVNLTLAADSLTLTNPALDAQIDTKVIVNLFGREIAKLPVFGFYADRNGQYIDSLADLALAAKSAGDTLTVPTAYIVENGAIVYNGNTYQAGERLTTVGSQTTFTTAVSGVLREIIEAPQRHTVMARFGDGGDTITVGTALTVGYYYYVTAGTVTYNSTTYNAGDIFKATDSNAFSGSGTVKVALSTETYQHYECDAKPTSNNTGDSRAGAIVRGNGDPDYLRGGVGVKEFPINAKFLQVRYILRVSNLKP